jgi:hypothetical protein
MISLVITFSSCEGDPTVWQPHIGFSKATIRRGIPTSIDLRHHILVILDAPPDAFNFSLTTVPRVAPHHHPFPACYLMLSGESVALGTSLDSTVLPVWLIPAALCSNASIVLNAEYFLSLRARAFPQERYDPVCVFSQTVFGSAELSVVVDTRQPDMQIEFYSAGSLTQPAKACVVGELCSYRSDSPFFLRIHGGRDKGMTIQFKYKVSQASPAVSHCSALSIPFPHEPGYAQITQVLGPASLSCRSQARRILGLLAGIAIYATAGLVLIVTLRCFGIIDFKGWLSSKQETLRFANLKKDAYASEIFDV